MKVFITKYALTNGIGEFDGEWDERYPGMIAIEGERSSAYFHGEGRDWHRDRGSAVARAETMRVTKIAALEKSITKLRALTFK